jgi:ubiquinone/menaquinone biosynthesis C-methylase UbiE
METVKETIFDYWSSWAPNFDTTASHVRHPDAWRDVLAAALPSPPARECLDLGTGTGACALALAANGHRVTGLDGAPGMLEQARQAAARQRLAVTFAEGDLDAAPFPDASFDAVTARNVFWTLPDPDRSMREVARLLRPGGVLLLADGLWRAAAVDPTASSHDMTDYAQIGQRLPFYRGLTAEDAHGLLDRHGFTLRAHWEHLFPVHPYAHQAGGACPFFVITARRP